MSNISKEAQSIMDYLGCECVHIPKGAELSAVNRTYGDLFTKREMGGYTPIIFGIDNYIIDHIMDLEPNSSSLDLQKKVLSRPQINAEKWFSDALTLWKEEISDGWGNVIGEIGNGKEMNVLSGMLDYNTEKSYECVIAKIPVTNPWEIFAWFPLGGWNDCPTPEDMFWIGKYWYEKHGAVPALITHDSLEFVARPVKDNTTAMDLALEHFTFCPDTVFQGVETIGRLADTLQKSSIWFFWWD